jgi:hypothetical protein
LQRTVCTYGCPNENHVFHIARLNANIYTPRDSETFKEDCKMQKWMSRFALLAVLGGLMASALVVGCGGPAEEEAPAGGGAPANAGSGNASP